MQINFSKYGFLLCLGLLAVQPVLAQNESIDDCAAEIDNDPNTPVDIDDDNDGLIELCYLEDVDAIRNNLSGTNLQRSDGTTLDMGCPDTGCNGYELVRDLDFTTTQSYVDGVVNADWVISDEDFNDNTKLGWSPLGTFASSAVFEGNGYRISNLHIDREGRSEVGLFVGNRGTIRNFGLSEIRVEGRNVVSALVARNRGRLMNVYVNEDSSVTALGTAGLLAGRNESSGLIINSHVRGTVSVRLSGVGGICAYSEGRIINSYADADVSGRDFFVGGLVGEIEEAGSVINSYAAGTVSNFANQSNTGGLIGDIDDARARVSNSYSITEVGSIAGGGLSGQNSGLVRDSYWDTETSGRSASRGGSGRTTEQLQMPTNQNATMGIYASWSSDDWDFGTSRTYAALRYAEGDDSDNPACDVDPDTPLPPCGAVLSGQTIRDKGLSILFFVIDGVQQDNTRVLRDQPFSPAQFTYDIKMPSTMMFQLRPYAINSTETISITKQGDTENTDYFDDKNSGELSDDIMLQAATTETLTITAGDVTYTLNIEVGPANRLRIVRFDSMPGAGNLIDEGQPVSLTIGIAGGSGNYAYFLQQGDTVLEQRQSMNMTETFNVVIPPDFVAADQTTQTIVYTITVVGEFETVRADLTFIAERVNNSTPQLRLNRGTGSLVVAHITDDPDGVGTFTYRWQRQITDGANWTDIPDANTARYALSSNTTSTIRYRVMVDHTDGQGNMSSYTLGPSVIDVDRDDDGLIEIYYLDNLDAIRHQLDGSGYKASGSATRITTGCPDTGCNGYELVGDLDFTTTQSYVSGIVNDDWVLSDDDFTDTTKLGWLPIGSVSNLNCRSSISRCFNSIFEGNGYRISNLHINRDGNFNGTGLFAGNLGTIRNFGLSEIRVEGLRTVGGLVGSNGSRLMNVYVDGDSSVMATTSNRAGPLAGSNARNGLIINSYAHGTVSLTNGGGFFAGGICGYSEGRIINSYADTDVSGSNGDLGGLVGEVDHTGSVINSYAAGIVFNIRTNLSDVGGLIGDIDNARASVSNSYSITRVRNSTGGGLVGTSNSVELVRDSYWDTETSGRTESAGGTGLMTAQLQMPTSATGIYANWSSDDWDFGDASSYPALRYARGDDNNNPACDVAPDTPLPPCGAVLSGQTIRDRGLSIPFFVVNGVQLDNARVFQDQPFSPLVFDYDITTPGRRTEIALRPYAINDTATISVLRASDNTSYFDGRHSGDLSAPIVLEAGMTATMRVRVDGLEYNFNLIRASQSPVEIVSFATIPSIATVNEGDDIRFQAVFRNGSGDYEYSLRQRRRLLAQGRDTTATITVTVPDNFVAAERTTQNIVYTITVDDGFDTTSTALMLTVSREDNGAPQLGLDVSPTELRITSVADDPDGVGTFSYQWQSRDEGDSDWTDVSGNNPYMVSGTPASTIRYRAIVNHTDGQGHLSTYRIGPFPIDVDGDDDGLIDVYYLEDLDAIRYQLDGSGYGLAAIESKITSGCRANTCAGYELLRDLDFTTTQSYVDATAQVQGQTTLLDGWTVDDPAVASDTGWLPIATTATPFTSLFNGNNNNISNLQINRDTIDGSIGLFAALSSEARLENVGLLNVAIEGRGYVGSLVARNEGAIVNSYAQGGEITGTQHSLGGLVAINVSSATSVIINSYANVITTSTEVFSPGGLVGRNRGVIRNSYASGDVSGPCDVGGLVAESFVGSEIVNSYASGNVHRTGGCMDDGTLDSAGGLVGYHRGLLKNSYASGRVSGSGAIGGLVGDAENSTVEFSYWDSTVNSDITADDEDGIATSTVVLQTPQSAEGIYADWSSDDWDFGTALQYPLLRYTSPTDIAIAAVCDDDLDTALPPCGSVLLAQAESGLSNLLFFVGDAVVAPDPPFSLSILSYAVNVENINTIELLPYVINPLGESIAIRRVGDPTPYFMGKRSGERSLPIPLPEGVSTLEIVVGTDTDDMSSVTYSTTVTNTVNRVVVEEIIAPDRVSEGDAISLSATVMGGALSGYMYEWTSDPAAFLAEQDRTAATLSFNVPIVFVSRDDTGRDVEITLTVNDGFTSSSETRTVTVAKADNGQPSFTETVTVSSISIAVVPGSDADGVGTIDSYTWQRRSADDSEWTTIPGETSAMFSIPTQDNGGTLYRVQVMTTDAQGNGFTSILGPYRNRTDIDDDDDGLIDIYYLEDLDAVRHQTDGSGYGTTDITRGCPSNSCMGYELRRDLDFASTSSYVDIATNGAMWTVDNFDTNVSANTGWGPIGSVAGNDCTNSSSDCFASVFEGNGFSISNLQINRDGTSDVGLFAGNTGTIRNLGLRDIEVEGNNRVGGLVGRNEGNLINAHVIDSRVEGSANNAGLLVGVSRPSALIINSYVRGTVAGSRWVGGICGLNFGRIINSYAEVMARGLREVGGLAAENQHGTIRNSYAMGSAHITSNDSANRRSVGGLLAVLWRVGDSSPNPSVTNSYSTARVTGNLERNNVGGLIGNTNISDPLITASYWDTDTSGQTASPAGGTSQTMSELITPTAPGATSTDVYYQWSTDDWDFGTSRTYAALKYNEVAGVDACDADAATPLPRCGSLLPGQRAEPVGENTMPTIMTDASLMITLVENAVTELNVVVNDVDDDALTVTVASSSDAVATAMVSGASGTRVLEIRGVGVGDATITVTVDDGRGRTNSTASLVFNVSVSANPAPMITLTPSTAQSLPLGAMRTIMVSVADSNYGEGDRVTLTTMSSDPTIVSVVPQTVTGIDNNTPRTLTLNALQGGVATITFTAEDSGGLVGNIVELSVRVNTPPTLSNIPAQPVRLLAGMNTSIDVTLGDADADDTPTIEVASDDTRIATVSESGSGATRTLEIVGVGGGDATITVTVNDNRGAANSVFSESFTVQVEGTVAPMLEIVSAPEQPIQLGNTTQVVVSVSDSNFDLGDRITLTAMSADLTIVSVMPIQIDDIGSDSRETLTLTANRAGTAEITVTATDLDDLSTSRTVTVIVNTPPTLSAQVPNRVDAMVDVRFERDISEFFSDADSDTLTYGIAIEPPSSLIDTFSTQTGVWEFMATDADASQSTAGSIVTVSADDGRGGRVQTSFTLLIDAPLTGTVRIAPESDDRWQLRAISMFADANGIATTSHEWFRVTNGRSMRVGSAENYTIPESNIARAAGTSYRLVVTVVDNIEQSSTLTATYTVANIAPMITQLNVVPSTTTEGRTVRMTATASDENFDGLNYSWRVSGINADEADVSGETAPLTIRDYFVTDATADMATAIFMVAVSDGTSTTIGRFSVVVNKEDNGVVSVDNLTRSPTTETRLILSGIDETGETDGGINGAVTYHWQQCLGSLGNDCSIDAGVGSGWQDIAGESGTLGDDAIFYEVPDMLSQPENHQVISGDRFRVRIAYTDLQGYTRSVYSSNLGARLGQNTAPTISVDDAQATDITLLEGGRITVPVSVDDSDGGILNVAVVSADDAIASATISGDGATRTLEISGEGAGETMITATVDDGTGEANATASIVFNVVVEENTAPTLMLEPSSAVILPVDDTTDVVVSVADSNFDLDDVVTLVAVSSNPSVVSVMPVRVPDITTDTSATFVLNAEQGGVSMITFTATDRDGLEARAELAVRVNTAPTLSGIPSAPVRLLEGVSRELVLTIADADADDTLAIRIDTDDSMIATATIIATSGAMRTLAVRGVGAGNTTITVVVNDGRGVANSQVSRQFAVQVEISEAPTIEIVSEPQQAIAPGGTADIVVRVSDANFDFGDRVALMAESSSRTIVSVMPERIDAIGSNMRETLTLSANKAGVAEIILTATDNEGLRTSETVVVTVNTPPTLSGIPDQPIRLLEGLGTEFDVVINDADADDNPSVRIDSSDSMIASATIIATTDAMRTLAVRGIGAGNAMITVTVDDGRGVANSQVSERFAVQVEANVAPVIMITQSLAETLPPDSTAQIVVSVADANFNLSDRVTLEAMSSSSTIVSVTPTQETDITTDTMITFTLSIEQDGEATITFIATDRGGLSNRVTVSVNDTDAAIRIRVKVFLEGPLQ